MSQGNGFTPTQKKIMDLLSDRQSHHRDELRSCILDEYSNNLNNLAVHLSHLRTRLAARRQTVACEQYSGKIYYRLIDLPVA